MVIGWVVRIPFGLLEIFFPILVCISICLCLSVSLSVSLSNTFFLTFLLEIEQTQTTLTQNGNMKFTQIVQMVFDVLLMMMKQFQI